MRLSQVSVGFITILLVSINIFSAVNVSAYTVTSTSPANGATEVNANQTYHVQFGQTMNIAHGTITINPLPAVNGAWSWSVNMYWLNYTGVIWNANTLYTLTFTSFKGTSGPASSFVRTFTTDVAPTVSAVSPANAAVDVGAFANYTINFSEQMNTAYNGIIINPTPSIAGSWAWSANKMWYNYTGEWDVAKTYTITLTTNFRCAHEFRLTGGMVYSFTTDDSILVKQTIPINHLADIPANRPYCIEFTDGMNPAYGTAAIQPVPTVAGAWGWSANLQWYNYTGMTWAPSTTYYVNLTGFICDDGFRIAGNLNYDFDTVAVGTTISFTSPSDGETNVGAAQPYGIMFNTTMNVSVGSVTIQPVPAVPGAWAWSANTRWYNYTGVTWTANTQYWVNASALFESDLGFVIQGDRTHVFTTDAPPAIISTSPADGATSVTAMQIFAINFDDNMNVSRGNITITPDPDINGTWAWDVSTRWYNYTAVTWHPGTTYTLVVSDFTCEQNFTIGADRFYHFQTNIAPTLTTTPSNDSVGILLGAHFDIQFTMPMNTTSGNVTISPSPVTAGIWAWSANTLWYNYSGATWTAGTNYWVNATNFTCVCGFSMQENKSVTFRTADPIAPIPSYHTGHGWPGGSIEPIKNQTNVMENRTALPPMTTEQYMMAGVVFSLLVVMAVAVAVLRRS